MYQILRFSERTTRCQKRRIVSQCKVYIQSLSGMVIPSIAFYGFQRLAM